ncbi:MAG: class I SAM-dependent methyltransferase [Acutalibacteraceae bacterium]|nr:class I SAM-dependent methyltransferase [Acutalibacteraceae bacterium]
MKNSDLLFYNEYEAFYDMTSKSKAFSDFCTTAFGEDFSQDGFSDISQIDRILKYIPVHNADILDIGCGNGKMLKYLQKKTNANIYGFDYSENAINNAINFNLKNSEFKTGVIGEIEYPKNKFDVIISMDTIYFAKDIKSFVSQVKSWLKPNGVFFVAYQEGDVMPKTECIETTEISKALISTNMKYEVIDITEETYNLLRKKRASAILHKEGFEQEGNKQWYDMLVAQTEYSECSYEEFKKKMSRYIFVARK